MVAGRHPSVLGLTLLWLCMMVIATLAGLPSVALAQPSSLEVTARIEPNPAVEGQPVQLIVEFQGLSSVNVTEPTSADFRVVGQRTFSNTVIRNSQVSTSTTWTFVLIPLRSGSLSTGPLRYASERGNAQLEPVTVEVQAAGGPAPGLAQNAAPSPGTPATTSNARRSTPPQSLRQAGTTASDDPADGIPPAPSLRDASMFGVPLPVGQNGPFLTVEVSDATAYPGQQLIVDYLLYIPASDFGLDLIGLSEPEFQGAWFRAVTEERQNTRRNGLPSVSHNNEIYTVRLVRSLIVVPLESGPLIVPPLQLELRRQVGFRRTVDLTIESPAARVEVDEPPETGRPPGWHRAHVGHYQLRANADRTMARVGDSVLVTITVQGAGNFTGLVPPPLPRIDGAQVLEPSDDTNVQLGTQGWMEGSFRRQFAVIPREQGDIVVPSMTFSYWDPWRETWNTTTSESITIRAAGFREGATDATNSGTDEQPTWLDNLPPPRLPGGDPAIRALPGPVVTLVAFIPVTAWMLVWTALLVRARRTHLSPAKQAQSERRERHAAARKSLETADAAQLETAFTRLFTHQLGAPAAADVAALERLARERWNDEIARTIGTAMRQLKALRFSGETRVPAELLRELQSLLDRSES